MKIIEFLLKDVIDIVRLRKKTKKNEFIFALNQAEIEALDWSEGDTLNKCVKGNRLIITALKHNKGALQ